MNKRSDNIQMPGEENGSIPATCGRTRFSDMYVDLLRVKSDTGVKTFIPFFPETKKTKLQNIEATRYLDGYSWQQQCSPSIPAGSVTAQLDMRGPISR